jgi:hypothetical protein
LPRLARSHSAGETDARFLRSSRAAKATGTGDSGRGALEHTGTARPAFAKALLARLGAAARAAARQHAAAGTETQSRSIMTRGELTVRQNLVKTESGCRHKPNLLSSKAPNGSKRGEAGLMRLGLSIRVQATPAPSRLAAWRATQGRRLLSAASKVTARTATATNTHAHGEKSQASMARSRRGKVEQAMLEYSVPRIKEELSRCGEQDAPANSSETQAGRASNGAGPI